MHFTEKYLYFAQHMFKHTYNILDTIVFSKKDVYKIIKNLDSNKVHGHDIISIRMIKLCGISICKPLRIIFQNCLRSGMFPSEWKKANIVPTFEKGDKNFLSCRNQRVLLNGQHSAWADVKACVPQGSILSPLLFLIYINDLSNGLNSNVKLFADDASLFSLVHNITNSANLLNSDLSKISAWALQWKMSFNPDPTKQAQEIIFIRKTSKRNYPGLMFNNNIINLTTIHKHLGMMFDSKLSFDEH